MTQQTITPQGAGFSLDRLIAALPEVVDVALKEAVPEQYTPEKAARIATDMVPRLHALAAVHYPWCESGACIAHEDEGQMWVEHLGALHHAVLTDGLSDPVGLVAQIGFDPEATDFPTVHVWESRGNCSNLDGPALEAAIGRLEELVGTLRQLHGHLTAFQLGGAA
ncbi:hypothetical protein ACFXAZ_12055 [Streptomyces sp. NPDC059477]|uniref:hypothetical protein n=1 Tax=Streptomyces sp. NPDC059477 TaxID=3346847 RepID=UPI0036897CA2